jgi:phosphoglycolate phosphatase
MMNTQAKVRLLMFDLDGTLIDSRHDICIAVNLLRANYDLPPLSIETVTSYVGDGIDRLVERSLRGYPVNIEKATRECAEYYRRHLYDETTLYPGVFDGLQRLYKAGYLLALISNKPAAACREILQHFEVKMLFAVVLGGGDTKHLKPHPEPLQSAMSILKANPADSWMIGDHKTDLEAARRAGIRSGFIKYGMGEQGGELATRVFESFEEMTLYFAA